MFFLDMFNPFPLQILQPADLIYRATMTGFSLHENSREEDTNGRARMYQIANNNDAIPPSWYWNQQIQAYEKFDRNQVYHVIETTTSLKEVITSTQFVHNRYLLSIDASFIASTFTRNNEAVRMLETPFTRLVTQSDFLQLTSFQQFFFDVYTEENQVLNERGFAKLADFVAANFQWRETLQEERLSIFAVVLRFTFDEVDFAENDDAFLDNMIFEFLTDESGFDTDDELQL